MKIFGAGLSGLIAAIANPKATVYERNNNDVQGHQALLRFRSTAISGITGVKFKKVKVIKSIWDGKQEVQPSPRLVAMYSKKNTGSYENRSIMDIDTTVRYIAPDDFQQQLAKECEGRIYYNYEIDKNDFLNNVDNNFGRGDIISTLPLSINARMLGYEFKTNKNESAIYVTKLLIDNCDMYCTVYYPYSYTTIYRASLTGNVLIIESKSEIFPTDIEDVIDSIGLKGCVGDDLIKNHKQPMGKLTALNDNERRVMIYKMSHDHGVFSLGRFALHKNILLDDVARDIRVIKEMMNDDSYGVSTKGRI